MQTDSEKYHTTQIFVGDKLGAIWILLFEEIKIYLIN